MKRLFSVIIISLFICICLFSISFSASFEETQRAAEQGDADAQYHLGMFYNLQNDYIKCKYWYKKSADQGNIDAQITL